MVGLRAGAPVAAARPRRDHPVVVFKSITGVWIGDFPPAGRRALGALQCSTRLMGGVEDLIYDHELSIIELVGRDQPRPAVMFRRT